MSDANKHGRGNFFAVGYKEFNTACDISLTCAVAYLVIACGTGKNLSTSCWSSTSIASYTGMNKQTAKKAIGILETTGLLRKNGDSTESKPRYDLLFSTKNELIWLPNSIVMGAAEEIPPLKRLKQRRDISLLRLFINLYHHQNMGFDGGINKDIVIQNHSVEKLSSLGKIDTYIAHYNATRTTSRKNNPYFDELFWENFVSLEECGLIEKSVVVFDGPIGGSFDDDADGDLLYSQRGPDEGIIAENCHHFLTIYAERKHFDRAYGEFLNACTASGDEWIAVPKKVVPWVYTLYRMRYRPRTAATSTWWARLNETAHEMEELLLKVPDTEDIPY